MSLKHSINDEFELKTDPHYTLKIVHIWEDKHRYQFSTQSGASFRQSNEYLDKYYNKIETVMKLKYKVGDRFEHRQNDCIVEISCFNRGVEPYVLLNGVAVSEYHLDNYYAKIEPKEQNEFKDIFNSLCKMVTEKDKRYGNSALQPLEIFAKHHNYGSRLDEKLARVKNSDELRKNDVADIIGGLILICKDKGWNNFDDQID